jgi:hypothetical protein
MFITEIPDIRGASPREGDIQLIDIKSFIYHPAIFPARHGY